MSMGAWKNNKIKLLVIIILANNISILLVILILTNTKG
jgi:hypothetical protein